MNKVDILWEYSKEQRSIGSGMDQQRISIANLVLTLSSGLTAIIAVKGFSENTIPLGFLVLILVH